MDMEFIVNGQAYYLDYEQCKKEQLWYQYRDKLLDMVGIGASDEYVKSANKYIYDNYPEFREFVTD